MSRRSQVTQARRALENSPRPAQQPEAQQVTIDQFVPLLIKNGAPVSFLVQVDEPNKRIRFLASCGPIQIPVDVDPAKAREIAVGLLDVLDKIDPQPEAAEETCDPNYNPETDLLPIDRDMSDELAQEPPLQSPTIILPFTR